ncbi:MAG: homoserine kinase [Gammaproteobacteria bacterium WSBS_2016_MAG_OTU1]
MAVFTEISFAQAEAWMSEHFGFASVSSLSPIAEGIENTNYLLVADSRRYVFTIFEIWDSDMTTYYAALTRHLSASGLPVPAPLLPLSDAGSVWEGKPCCLTPFIEGESHTSPTDVECSKMGQIIADLHVACASFSETMPNPRGSAWRQDTAKQLQEHVSAETWQVLQTALIHDAEFNQLPLPSAACHCDLFRNNVLWQNGNVAGVIDFYFGGDDALIFDLAVCACDWCFEHEDGVFSAARLAALVEGYEQRRMLSDLERACFHNALHVAALRFWISRLYDIHYPRHAQMLAAHDPKQFEIIFLQAQQIPPLPMNHMTTQEQTL